MRPSAITIDTPIANPFKPSIRFKEWLIPPETKSVRIMAKIGKEGVAVGLFVVRTP